jgi:hypothetical protein
LNSAKEATSRNRGSVLVYRPRVIAGAVVDLVALSVRAFVLFVGVLLSFALVLG